MAITLVSSGALEGAALDGGDVTLTFPGGVAEGDVVYVWGGHDRGAGETTRDAAINTSGYTTIYEDATDFHQYTFIVARKVMGPTPDSDVVCEGGGDASEGVAYCAYILRGVDTGTPEDATRTVAADGSTNPNPPAITTVTNGAWVLTLVGSSVSDASVTAPSGYGNQVDVNADDTRNSTVAGATLEKATAGAEDPGTWTNWGNSRWQAVTVAVRPATGASGGKPWPHYELLRHRRMA
jgi:hypothetical protein